jgi:GNAT superfamily N-acetyltransferase
MSNDLTIRHELRCGDLGRIIALHGEVYGPIPGFGLPFEAFVGRTMAEFILDNDGAGRLWLLERDGKLVGCTAIILRGDQQGQVRWVVVDPSERGQGHGRKMVGEAVDYCRKQNCKSVYLETTDGLVESQTLYESFGFRVASNTVEELWDGTRPLIYMQLDLA